MARTGFDQAIRLIESEYARLGRIMKQEQNKPQSAQLQHKINACGMARAILVRTARKLRRLKEEAEILKEVVGPEEE